MNKKVNIAGTWSAVNSICCILIITSMATCLNITDYPDEPQIVFEKSTVKDTTDSILGNPIRQIKLTISFTDGDGNIGLDDDDTLAPQTFCPDSACKNLYVNGFGVKGGVTETLKPQKFRVPLIIPKNQKKALKGTIDVDLIELVVIYDTMYYELYLYDRTLNRSNVVRTPDIVK